MEGEAFLLVDDSGVCEGEEQVGGLVRGGLGIGQAGDGGGQGVEGRGLIGDAARLAKKKDAPAADAYS